MTVALERGHSLCEQGAALRRAGQRADARGLLAEALAAAGQTNREIALALYVTLKTVEGHLARGYAKLGIAGRAELPEALEAENTRVPTP